MQAMFKQKMDSSQLILSGDFVQLSLAQPPTWVCQGLPLLIDREARGAVLSLRPPTHPLSTSTRFAIAVLSRVLGVDWVRQTSPNEHRISGHFGIAAPAPV